jgi:carboxylate-amine ligase
MRTFGVEEELLLVDARTGLPLALAPEALANAQDPGDGPELDSEIHQEMIEAQSRAQLTTTALLADVVTGRTRADSLVKPLGARAAALAMSPLHVRPHPTVDSRYSTMLEHYGITARGTLVCGCHVHVSIESREEGVAVLDRIRNWLHVLLALSANSPYANGVDTGYASFRFAAWHQWQVAGPTDVFGSIKAYDTYEQVLVDTEVILDPGMLYLDARLSRKQPTVEVRVADVCLDARDTAILAALVRALVDTAAEEWRAGIPPVAIPSAALRLAGWQAALTGVAGRLPHPEHGRGGDARDAVAALVAHVDRALVANGDDAEVREGLKRMLATGGGAGRQREAFGRRGHLRDVVEEAVAVTHASGGAAAGAGLSVA